MQTDKRKTDKERTKLIPQSQKAIPTGDKVLKFVKAYLDDDKAEGIVVIDLEGKTEIADYLVIATGTSQRHVGAMTDHIQRKLKTEGVKGIAVEGTPQCDWVLIDAGDVIIHLFRPEVRDFYNLEKIWTAPTAPATETLSATPA
ncbi:MAG: ribosome silencing factor [Rhodospirillales bacterium]|nr:ribosome silencing factor [Rhodospirillales bacterium]